MLVLQQTTLRFDRFTYYFSTQTYTERTNKKENRSPNRFKEKTSAMWMMILLDILILCA